ncbi:Adenine DNA glycosylase [Cladobotryum mycophilum]|uniref:Adenine DNA glycosylase n=1 Tax=Cladobotryum mycophilum TaxID=491253 RepID=A0ABR0SBV4_9HYPO
MPAAKRQRTAAPKPSSAPRKNPARTSKTSKRDDEDFAIDDDGESDFAPEEASALPINNSKKRKAAASSRSSKQDNGLFKSLFDRDNVPSTTSHSCAPPLRKHSVLYHRPLLLDGQHGSEGRKSLLTWFDSVSESRSMPWRKPWVNPEHVSDPTELRKTLEQRAYQVWISEIMLQQTRVAVVIDYWNRWMAKWPTIHDLASAQSEDVLAAWSGLGYYSRATRIHEAAKLAVGDPELKGLLPSSAKDLEAKMPGVGRYTAGAISCIVFGRAEPMVDGNVLRVLSRQLGIHGNIKTDKAVIDTIWAAADAIVKATAELDGDSYNGRDEGAPSKGQITVCTPKPNCSLCPITSTCRVYQEGEALATNAKSATVDIEDACTLCEPFEESLDDSDEDSTKDKSKGNAKKLDTKSAKQPTLAAFSFTRKATKEASSDKTPKVPKASMETIANHARKFPVKVIKKAVREEETLVCAIRRKSDGQYLIHQRPLKGLLAGLWELPSKLMELPAKGSISPKKRGQMAQSYVSSLLDSDGASIDYVGELGSVPWLFSHIKLTMHVHLFVLDDSKVSVDYNALEKRTERPSRWVVDDESESMGTGMRKCWTMVKEQDTDSLTKPGN